MNPKEEALEKLAKALSESIKGIFKERGEVRFSAEPVPVKKNIIEYQGRMRANGMEKFNNPTFVSCVNYYASAKDMEKHNALGAVIVYIEQSFVVDILRMLKYPPADDENMDALCDCCGTLCNIIAGRFKSAVSSMGYIELEMSSFVSSRNSITKGVEFCFKEYDKYEIPFYINGTKRLIVEMTMGTIPKAK